jgi:hypothetical protein
MKKKNKFNIRGNLKKKLIVALYGVSTLLGVWIAKEAKENLDAEIALAAAKPVAQEVAYVEDSENQPVKYTSHEDLVSEKVEEKNEENGFIGFLKHPFALPFLFVGSGLGVYILISVALELKERKSGKWQDKDKLNKQSKEGLAKIIDAWYETSEENNEKDKDNNEEEKSE